MNRKKFCAALDYLIKLSSGHDIVLVIRDRRTKVLSIGNRVKGGSPETAAELLADVLANPDMLGVGFDLPVDAPSQQPEQAGGHEEAAEEITWVSFGRPSDSGCKSLIAQLVKIAECSRVS